MTVQMSVVSVCVSFISCLFPVCHVIIVSPRASTGVASPHQTLHGAKSLVSICSEICHKFRSGLSDRIQNCGVQYYFL